MFLVQRGELEGRLDAPFYTSAVLNLEKRIKAISTLKLSDFIQKMASGATPSVQEEAKYYSDKNNGVPFIRVQNLSPSNELLLDDLRYINIETHQNYLKRSQVFAGDLLVKITGVGRMAIASVAPEGFEGNTNQHLVVIKTKNRATSEILATFLNTDIGEKLASRRATGGTRPALDYNALRSIPIVYMPESVQIIQNAIQIKQQKETQAAQLLASIDGYLLEKLGITLPQAVEKKKTYVVWSDKVSGGRFDPFYYANQYYKIEGGLYENQPLKRIASLNKGQSITKDSIKSGNYPVIAGGQTSPYSHENYNQESDVITISASGAYAGYVWHHKERIFASDCTVVRAKNDANLTTTFLFEMLQLKQKEIYNLQQGAGQPHVYASDLGKMMIPIPPMNVQTEIVTHISTLRTQAQQLETEAKTALTSAKAAVEKSILG
jgi:type I restriction enzyme, S subunit